jgi:hypothetical protein
MLEGGPHPGRQGCSRRASDEAPRYPEGTAIRFEDVRSKDTPLIKKLAKIKIEN